MNLQQSSPRPLAHFAQNTTLRLRQTRSKAKVPLFLPGSGETLTAVRMVPVDDLPRYGFSERLSRLVAHGFPNKGTYQGEFHSFYG